MGCWPFQHSIETEDEEFSAAFLRPVLLTLQDDLEYAADARKIENKATRVRSYGCMGGCYIIDTRHQMWEMPKCQME